MTNPVDVIKTRMQVQGPVGPLRGTLHGLAHVGRTEGVRGLQRGLGPSCLWQFSNVSVRFGVYGSVKRLSGVDDNSGLSPLRKWAQSLGIAAVSGALAAVASNPFFILKTRFQSAEHDNPGGVLAAARDIWRADGLPGFFRGLSAFAPRVIVASAVQLSTYDAVKDALKRHTPLRDGLPLFIGSSFVTGIAVVGCMQPFDFAATNLVNSKTTAEELSRPPKFSGPFDVIRQTVRAEGVRGVYRGAMANYLRFGPYCVLVFVFVENGRRLEAAAVRWWRTDRGG